MKEYLVIGLLVCLGELCQGELQWHYTSGGGVTEYFGATLISLPGGAALSFGGMTSDNVTDSMFAYSAIGKENVCRLIAKSCSRSPGTGANYKCSSFSSSRPYLYSSRRQRIAFWWC